MLAFPASVKNYPVGCKTAKKPNKLRWPKYKGDQPILSWYSKTKMTMFDWIPANLNRLIYD